MKSDSSVALYTLLAGLTVLGVGCILSAITGGNIEIKDIKLPKLDQTWARWTVGIVGLVLLIIAFLGFFPCHIPLWMTGLRPDYCY